MKRIGFYHNPQSAWYDYANENGLPYIILVNLPTPDNELNCAEAWYDFGNYKDVGLDKDATLVRCTNVVYDINKGTAWNVREEGEWWNHSESCNCPGRHAFGEAIDVDPQAFEDIKNAYNVRNDLLKTWEEDHKKYRIEEQVKIVEHAQQRLKESVDKLNDLKCNHPRAYRQIENATKAVDEWTRIAASKENQLKEMTK